MYNSYPASQASKLGCSMSLEKRKLIEASNWRDRPTASWKSDEPLKSHALVDRLSMISNLQRYALTLLLLCSLFTYTQLRSVQAPSSAKSQAYCTCRQCIGGFISPRMKWLLSRSIYPMRSIYSRLVC